MSVESRSHAETVAEELVEITSGRKTYLVPKALADDVERRRTAAAQRGTQHSAPKQGTTKKGRQGKRRRRRASSRTASPSWSRSVYTSPGRGRVRLIA
jgi:hypothetical protein